MYCIDGEVVVIVHPGIPQIYLATQQLLATLFFNIYINYILYIYYKYIYIHFSDYPQTKLKHICF